MMMKTRAYAGILVVSLACAALLCAGRAGASGKPTYVEIDMHLGMTTAPYESMGMAFSYGGMIGIGGKLKYLPPRFYFMAGVLHQAYGHEGTYSLTSTPFTASQSVLDISLGLRIVMPIHKGLRIYGDLMAIASRHKSEVTRDSHEAKVTKSWIPGGLAAIGLQYRWHRNASTGIRLEGTFYGPLNSAAMRTVGLDPQHNAKLLMAIVQSWYF